MDKLAEKAREIIDSCDYECDSEWGWAGINDDQLAAKIASALREAAEEAYKRGCRDTRQGYGEVE